ncbi:uncharacterized protein MONBRDRAFT_13410, partial [Monosiga brevicollis MX1]
DGSDDEREVNAASDDESNDEAKSEEGGQGAAWEDEDDQQLAVDIAEQKGLRKLRTDEEDKVIDGGEYEQRLRAQFQKIHGRPQWAAQEGKEAEEDEESLLRTSARLISRRSAAIPAHRLKFSTVRDGNHAAPSKAVLQVLGFHPSAPALFTAGMDRTLRLFQVDGKKNALLQSTFLKDMPIMSAGFTPQGNKIFLSGRRPFFYSFDLERTAVERIPRLQGRAERSLERMWVSPDDKHLVFTGKDGALLLVSQQSRHWICDLHMNGPARHVAFNSDGSVMYSSGEDGKIYVWDMNTRDCTHVFVDEGCLRSTSLAVSPDDEHVATGSDSGIVNIYNSSCLRSTDPTPVKVIKNLVTQIDNLSFNHDGQLLAMGSRMTKQALRLVHVNSTTVYNNFPTTKTPLHYVHSLGFSPNGGYFAVGNDKGRVPLFRLNHYSNV